MTVKVVRGLVNPVDSTSTPVTTNQNREATSGVGRTHATPGAPAPQSVAHAGTQVATQVSAHIATSEAVVTTLKSSRSNQSPEKIKDIKEARSVAKNAADKITSFGKASLDAHSGLDSASAQTIL